MRYVPDQPQQGTLYHLINAKVGLNYSGLGPNNIPTASFSPMVGRSFQKPLSGSTTAAPPLQAFQHR